MTATTAPAATFNTQPVLLITTDRALLDMWRRDMPDVVTLTADDGQHVGDAWATAPAVVIGSDAEPTCRHLRPRGGVTVALTPTGGPIAPGVATAHGPIVDMGQRHGAGAVLARVLEVIDGPEPTPTGCDDCGAAAGQPCTGYTCWT